MKKLKIYIGNQTPDWKKTISTNFFSRLGFTVSFEERTYLINGLEIAPEQEIDIRYINTFNYVYSLEETSQKRLNSIRLKKPI
jgi:hypothetical protein